MKKIYFILILILIVIAGFIYFNNKKVNVIVNDTPMVEQYIRNNIKTLAPESPVLGGSWYVVNVEVNPNTKTGIVVYEDGHIQGKAFFSYEKIGSEVKITNIVKN
ncbi:MAG TPA: hypothetical protein VMR49_03905 [Candidatus Paceibacterota bacterium]|jgi:predicted small secreted protein|nr:hypothetical protein [Candidatus Paceibacterota bacterium]